MEAVIALLILAFLLRKSLIDWIRVSYRQGKIITALKELLGQTDRGVFFAGDIEKASLEYTRTVWEQHKKVFELPVNPPHKISATVYILGVTAKRLQDDNHFNADAVLIACANATDDVMRTMHCYPLTALDRFLIVQTLEMLREFIPPPDGYTDSADYAEGDKHTAPDDQS